MPPQWCDHDVHAVTDQPYFWDDDLMTWLPCNRSGLHVLPRTFPLTSEPECLLIR